MKHIGGTRRARLQRKTSKHFDAGFRLCNTEYRGRGTITVFFILRPQFATDEPGEYF